MQSRFQFVVNLLVAIPVTCFGPFAVAQQSPADELARMQPAEEFDVALFAAEPMIANPSAIDVDSRGRVWVAEIQWYRSQAKDPPADSIKVLEDTDGDGKSDKVTTFAEGLFCPMSICVAGDKVYVATSPDLWEFEDKNCDLKADGPPRKLLTGFGGLNHDHGAHSLVLGPDQKWWMSIGDGGLDVTGTDGSRMAYQWGAIVRGELDGSKLEVVASNFRNPYELCVNSFGEAFVSDNDNDGNESTRFCWILEGGNYGWYGRPPARTLPGTPWGEHWHFRGHIPGHVPALLVTGFGAPSGMCFYEGDAWGPTGKNVALLAEAAKREIVRFRPKTTGFGMQATSDVVLKSEDFYFRPDDICTGPRGELYVADWYDGDVGGHAYNNPEQGRIFIVRPKVGLLKRLDQPGPYDNAAAAIDGLKSPNLATQYLARERLLADGQSSVPHLVELLANEDPNIGARALWVLDRVGGPARAAVVEQLKNKEAAFRALAVRILRRHGDEYMADILPLANDPSGEVTREVLLAIRSARNDEGTEALVKIAKRFDGTDRYLLEAINIAGADRKPILYEHLAADRGFTLAQISLLQLLNPGAALDRLRQELSKGNIDESTFSPLLACANAMSDPAAGKILLKFVTDKSVAPELRERALVTVAAHLKDEWDDLTNGQELAIALRSALGDPGLQESALRIVEAHQLQVVDDPVQRLAADPKAQDSTRIAAIRTMIHLAKSDAKVELLRKLLADAQPTVREAALIALVVDLQDLKTATNVLCGKSDNFTAAERATVAMMSLNTPGGASMMSKLVEEGNLPADLKKQLIAKAVEHPDANVRHLFERFVPPDQRQARLGEAISASEILKLKGDPVRGDAIFHQNSAAKCMSCHRIHGEGGAVGPGLSTIGSKYDRPQLLETILKPSKAIAPEYVSYTVETKDGRVLGGLLSKKRDGEIELKDSQGKTTRLPRSSVESMVAQPISMMPELVLRDISAQDAADLLAYLATLR